MPTNARVTIVRMSSLPLPHRIQSGSTPCNSPARMRNAVAIGSGYFCSPACTTRPIAAFTFARTLVRILIRIQLDELLHALRLLARHVAFHLSNIWSN